MGKLRAALLLLFFALLTSEDPGQGGRPIPPGVRQADQQTNPANEAPAKPTSKSVDPAKLKQEAQELASLSAAMPAQIDLVSHGQLPKDLSDQLKRIEKLAKHLRSEISP